MTIPLKEITGQSFTCALSITSGSPIAVEIASSIGFGALVVDAQHGPVSPYSHEMASMIRAAGATSTPVFVRLPESTPGCINRALNDGVAGVIVPHISTPEDARAVADASRYPPVGVRGAAPVVRAAGYGTRDWDEYQHESTHQRMVLCLLSSRSAVLNAEAIVKTPGIDGIVLDIATLAREADDDSATPSVIPDAVAAAELAGRHGATCGAVVRDERGAKQWKSVGCNLVVVESDTSVALQAMTNALNVLKGAVTV
ncbi:HpcH/HpaI aldolase/citrate lyase family protein [Rhodococcus sp. ACS1]|uniref:HpcH/HpaI aldolase family protein n=1 Tax=Rhodococcus sp. ACS1 TaxID=2028570 RepID=UPI0015CAD823|nr:aldolase/citrate lyase family protein [Rhodococcus sp. ACS1]